MIIMNKLLPRLTQCEILSQCTSAALAVRWLKHKPCLQSFGGLTQPRTRLPYFHPVYTVNANCQEEGYPLFLRNILSASFKPD